MAKTNSSDPNHAIAGLVFVGWLLVGAGIGFAVGQLVVGAAIGLGLGFIGVALVLRSKS